MPGPTDLNAHSPHRWAAVASGTVWKRHSLGDAGTLRTETLRGPLIVWAKKEPGEEEGPALGTPTPTALDLRVFAVNTAAHFERIGKAAGWKVRHSVRWKTRRQKVRAVYIAFVKAHAAFSPMSWPAVMRSYALAFARHRRKCARKLGTQSTFWRFSKYWLTLDRETGERASQKPKEYFGLIEKYFESLKRTADRPVYFSSPRDSWEMLPDEAAIDESFNDDDTEEVVSISESDWEEKGLLHSPRQVHTEYFFFPKRNAGEGVNNWLNIGLIERHTRAELLGALRVPGLLALLFKRLEAAAFLAHVRRRVRPAPRRDRVPRPVHTRPRPPSAPLAPPVTC